MGIGGTEDLSRLQIRSLLEPQAICSQLLSSYNEPDKPNVMSEINAGNSSIMRQNLICIHVAVF